MIATRQATRRRFTLACAASVLAGSTGISLAQPPEWPSRPVTIVVPYPAGGGPDLLARVLCEKLGARRGQPFIVDNRPGASGMLGAGMVSRASADGYTLLLSPSTLVISPHVLPQGAGGVDVMRDLVPIVAPAVTPMVMLASPQLGVKDVQQVLAYARKNPGLAYATPGNGSPMHFAGEMFKEAAHIDMLHVPYRGAAPSITAVLGGEVQLAFSGLGAATPQIRAGKLVPLALTEKARSPLAPQIATAGEQGLPGVEINAWFGLFAPKATPPAVNGRLNKEINEILALPDVREKLGNTGIEPRGGTAAQHAQGMKEDNERYGRIARQLSIKAD